MIVATANLLRNKPQPTIEEIREGLNGNLCRCTGYTRIFGSVRTAAERMSMAQRDELVQLTGGSR